MAKSCVMNKGSGLDKQVSTTWDFEEPQNPQNHLVIDVKETCKHKFNTYSKHT